MKARRKRVRHAPPQRKRSRGVPPRAHAGRCPRQIPCSEDVAPNPWEMAMRGEVMPSVPERYSETNGRPAITGGAHPVGRHADSFSHQWEAVTWETNADAKAGNPEEGTESPSPLAQPPNPYSTAPERQPGAYSHEQIQSLREHVFQLNRTRSESMMAHVVSDAPPPKRPWYFRFLDWPAKVKR